MSTKICKNCGETVDENVKFCPYCKSTSFTQTQEIVTYVKPGLVQKLFYWQYDGQFILAKSKIAGITVFLLLFLASFTSPFFTGMLIVSLIIGLLVFLVLYLIHYLKGKPSKAKLQNNNYGLIIDLKNLLFYWQNNKTGEYVLSKTKTISFVVFVLFTLLALSLQPFNVPLSIIVAAVFTAPAFIIGFAVHKITNNNPTNPVKIETKTVPKVESKNEKVIPSPTPVPEVSISEFEGYKAELEDLKRTYATKESHARHLIEKKFHPPQITYTKFISVVDSSTKLFNSEADKISNIISLASEDSPRIDSEIKAKFKTLNAIIDKLDDLTNELVLSLDSTEEGDVEGLLDDMENLIVSIKDYE